VTLRSTKGVIKNIIPAIASTNAVIAAACANEAFKFATNASGFLNNYMMYNGGGGVYTFTFEYERKPNCLGCGTVDNVIEWNVNPDQKWEDFIEDLAKDSTLQLTRPSIRSACLCPRRHHHLLLPHLLRTMLTSVFQVPGQEHRHLHAEPAHVGEEAEAQPVEDHRRAHRRRQLAQHHRAHPARRGRHHEDPLHQMNAAPTRLSAATNSFKATLPTQQ
jgi:hypothetical protein